MFLPSEEDGALWLASASRDSMVVIWDASSGEVIDTFATLTSQDEYLADWMNSRALSNELDTFVFLSATTDGRLFANTTSNLPPAGAERVAGHWLWDRINGAVEIDGGNVETFANICRSILLPDGNRVISSLRDGSYFIWNVGGGSDQEIVVRDNLALSGNYAPPVYDIHLSTDGSMVAMTNGVDNVRLSDLETGSTTHQLNASAGVYFGAFSEDNTRFAWASSGGQIQLWDVEGGQSLTDRLTEKEAAFQSLVLGRDGQILAPTPPIVIHPE